MSTSLQRVPSFAPVDTGAHPYPGLGPRWLLAPRDTRPTPNVFPAKEADGVLGQVSVSPDARSRLSSLMAGSQSTVDDDPLSAPFIPEVLLPVDFRLGPSWTADDYRLVANLVADSFEDQILRCPPQVRGLDIESPSYAWAGVSCFAVRLRWAGLNRELQLRSKLVALSDLDSTARGIEAAWIILDTVAAQATSLLNDLAAEGVRTAEWWNDAQAEADAAADDAWLRHHRWQRLRWWLHRNLAFGRRTSAQPSLRAFRGRSRRAV